MKEKCEDVRVKEGVRVKECVRVRNEECEAAVSGHSSIQVIVAT